MITPSSVIACIGFGEAGSIFGAGLAQRGCAVRAYDLLLDAEATRSCMRERIEGAGVDPAFTLAAALRGAKLVLSVVSTQAAHDVVRTAAPLLAPGQVFLEISTITPTRQREHAALIEASGAHHVVAAIAGSLHQHGLAVPLQLAGARADELAAALNALGFAAQAVAPGAGLAYDPAHEPSLRPAAAPIGAPVRRGELP